MIKLPNSSNSGNLPSANRTVFSPPPSHSNASKSVSGKTSAAWKATLLTDEVGLCFVWFFFFVIFFLAQLNSRLFEVEEHYQREEEASNNNGVDREEKSEGVVETLEQFYAWFSEMESMAHAHGADSQFNLEHLLNVSQQTKQLINELDSAMEALEALSERHSEVEGKTRQLHTETEALLQEKTQLALLAAALHEQLKHFKVRT